LVRLQLFDQRGVVEDGTVDRFNIVGTLAHHIRNCLGSLLRRHQLVSVVVAVRSQDGVQHFENRELGDPCDGILLK
jgi:hypothetical protein